MGTRCHWHLRQDPGQNAAPRKTNAGTRPGVERLTFAQISSRGGFGGGRGQARWECDTQDAAAALRTRTRRPPKSKTLTDRPRLRDGPVDHIPPTMTQCKTIPRGTALAPAVEGGWSAGRAPSGGTRASTTRRPQQGRKAEGER